MFVLKCVSACRRLMKLDLASAGMALSLSFILIVLFEIFRINSYRISTCSQTTAFCGNHTIYILKNPIEFLWSVRLSLNLLYRGFVFVERCLMFLLCRVSIPCWLHSQVRQCVVLKCCEIISEQLSQYGEMTTVYLGRKPSIQSRSWRKNASSFSGRSPIPC